MRIREIGFDAVEAWDTFVAGHRCGHLLQSYRWGEFKARYGWSPVRIAVEEGGQIIGAAQLLLRSALGFTVGYVPRGPVVDFANDSALDLLLRGLRYYAKRRRAIFLKIEPNLPYDVTLVEQLERHGFQRTPRAIQASSTILVDLACDHQAILAQMKNKTRYNVRLAERRGVVVDCAGSPHQFSAFHDIMQETGERDSFAIRPLDYYLDVWKTFHPRGESELFLASVDGSVVAGLFAMSFGREAIYMYGASSDKHRDKMPNHLLQWSAMRWAKERGCSAYDFWGIPEAVGAGTDERENLDDKNVRDGLWGVYRFKQGFGGQTVRYLGAFDQVYLSPLYRLWTMVRPNQAE
ncbi:MAG: peptidoglycan bridge formation glycyltransferase FemA/FemB family protein [Chloroflexi bacterium]|nr:peptidoglycan bridge formation glycyltransferase FemA/FemB family protein [Chloroflexota bacterium]